MAKKRKKQPKSAFRNFNVNQFCFDDMAFKLGESIQSQLFVRNKGKSILMYDPDQDEPADTIEVKLSRKGNKMFTEFDCKGFTKAEVIKMEKAMRKLMKGPKL